MKSSDQKLTIAQHNTILCILTNTPSNLFSTNNVDFYAQPCSGSFFHRKEFRRKGNCPRRNTVAIEHFLKKLTRLACAVTFVSLLINILNVWVLCNLFVCRAKGAHDDGCIGCGKRVGKNTRFNRCSDCYCAVRSIPHLLDRVYESIVTTTIT